MVSTPARVSALIAATAALSVDALAQRMLVNVRDAALKTGAAGAVVTVVERETGAQVYGLTNDAGRVSIRLPSPGVWAASVRRIGVAPASAAAVRVDSGQSVTVSIVVTSVRFTLPGVRVSVAATCGRAPRGDDRAATLWEQVSLALRASALTRADSADAPALWVEVFERSLDRAGKQLRQTPLRSGRGSDRPFFAAHPDSLLRNGYIRREREGDYQYFAPDEIVLLSESFLRTHCFESPAADADPRLAELNFRPVPDRSLPDIASTAFVDTATGELRRIDFRFVGVVDLFAGERPDAGGDVSLRQLPDGRWVVSAWTIRMPTFLRVVWRGARALTGYREVGGVVTVGGDAPRTLPRVTDARSLDIDSLPRDTLASRTPSTTTEPAATSADTARSTEYQFGRLPGSNLSGRRITVTPSSPRPPNMADRTTAANTTSGGGIRRGGITARIVEARSGFELRRGFGVGAFFDSTALASQPGESALDLLHVIPALRQFRVPDESPRPPADADIDLERERRAGAELPMVPMATTESTTPWLCLVKLFVDGQRASVAQLRSLPATALAALEFYGSPRDVPSDFRRSGNRCGTAILWSYAADRPTP